MKKHTKCKKPKWFSFVNDTRIDTPQQEVNESVIRAQMRIADSDVLVQDMNSSNDPVIALGTTIDQAKGNVFYTMSKCDLEKRKKGECGEVAKLAFSVDDRVEVTIQTEQTGNSIRDWFSLSANTLLYRDIESPNDEEISIDATATFSDGPVFYTRGSVSVTIIVEGTPHCWAKKKITFEEVVNLEVPGYPQNPPITYAVTYKRGPGNKPEGILVPGASVKVKERMVFNVSETGQS